MGAKITGRIRQVKVTWGRDLATYRSLVGFEVWRCLFQVHTRRLAVTGHGIHEIGDHRWGQSLAGHQIPLM